MAASTAALDTAVSQPLSSSAMPDASPPAIEQLRVEEPGAPSEDIVYPSGPKLWLAMISLCIAIFLNGLDLTIVAVAVLSLTNKFKTIADIGWYSAAYGLASSAFVFFFGKVYTVFSMKYVFILGVAGFEVGSLLCTFSTSSKMFITGRAVAGFGVSAVGGGYMKLLKHLFPLRQQALMGSIVGGCQSVGLVSAPIIGGALIDSFTWRACFGINIPLGVLCIALIAYGFEDPLPDPHAEMPWREKVKHLDLFGTTVAVPAITLLMLALQWGGTMYGWNSPIIIVFFVLAGCLILAFAYLQYRQGDQATLPPRIARQRSMIAGVWYTACCNGVLAVTEYYISIFFQGVRGYTATKSGLLGVPMIVGFSSSLLAAGVCITWMGYYFPFMLATSILTPVASGLLTTIDFRGSIVKATALLGFVGVAIGLGVQGPQLAVQTVLDAKDVSSGGAMIVFGAGMGSALWICASATLFHKRLLAEISQSSPTTNATVLSNVGLSDIRSFIGSERLDAVLSGYNEAVVQTLYLPLALGILTIVGSIAMERRSIKKKQS
ncbi:hypothetical protein A1O3_06526 [Capronia epimyces CBS 606.96]|uniref:Major facilitator superfamily (MFS) profile domain-containing protein n=1 Tax=Capronia epimyces CBS 606.96 TaxID=1182542 RepID=W9XQ81_9EURO|nr:uncharacterized protein A1O3_06526 [Capronia epimyces CBS 606.96]EXJ82712.1 hypothetical protein A1O3_06526 [Capronia epimyces CBS 606.96]